MSRLFSKEGEIPDAEKNALIIMLEKSASIILPKGGNGFLP
jgi:hypothetical protein